MYNLTKEELKVLKKLDTARKIQDFLDTLKINFEEKGETCMSPRQVLRAGKCHCIEGALLAYLALKINNKPAWLVDLRATKDDFDHVICLFRERGKYGCISKSNHAAHRFREPVYRDAREITMSIFHEYIDNKGRKTLRSFSVPVELDKFKDTWVTSEENLWDIHDYLDKVRHFDILNKGQGKILRKADKIEIEAGKITEWKPSQ